MQQQLLRYYGNATGCIGHATKETQHVTILILVGVIYNWLEYSVVIPRSDYGKYGAMSLIRPCYMKTVNIHRHFG
jgi:hypothetical protein